MIQTYKILGQSKPGAATLTDAYTVPALTHAIANIVATNQSATPTSIRISIAVAGLADTAKQYIEFDMPITANQVLSTPDMRGISLGPADVIRVFCTLATVSFNITGVEFS